MTVNVTTTGKVAMNIFDRYSFEDFQDTSDAYTSVFEEFDRDKDGFLDVEEFKALLDDLLASKFEPKHLRNDAEVASFLSILDLDKDGHVSLEEFKYAWNYWLKQILKPVKALVIVDVQNDFISGTLSLQSCPAGQDGASVVPVINSLLDQDLFDVIVYSLDWHPQNHISFLENVHKRNLHPSSKVSADNAKAFDQVVFDIDGKPREQTLWPAHCIQESWGSQMHSDLRVIEDAMYVKKGTNPDVDSYSAFWDNDKLGRTELCSLLAQQRVTDVYVCGLAYDVCVAFTAKDAVDHGFRTVFIEDAARGVTLDGIAKSKEDLMAKGVYFTTSSKVPSLTKSTYRPACLAAQAALNYKVAWKIVNEKSKSS